MEKILEKCDVSGYDFRKYDKINFVKRCGRVNNTLKKAQNSVKMLYDPCLCDRLGEEPVGTTRDQIIYAKKLRDGAFHPDTGDLQNVFGRMSFQVPGGMAITGVMLTFYK